MPAFDRTFLDADLDQVIETLAEAEQAANKRARIGKLELGRDEYARFVRSSFGHPKGSRRWVAGTELPALADATRRATLVGVAWWTDHVGRKHARVIAGRLADDLSEMPTFGPLDADRPPLWKVYPRRAVLRTRPGQQPELLVWCGCGAVGTVESIAWMGECCGPCFDRREETGDRSAPEPPTEWRHKSAVGGIAFADDGARIASADFAGLVQFVDPDGRVRRKRELYLGTTLDSIAFAGNGTHVLLAGYGGRMIYDFDGDTVFEEAEGSGGSVLTGAALSLAGDAIAETGQGGLYLLERTQPGHWHVAFNTYIGQCVAFGVEDELIAHGRPDGRLEIIDRTEEPPEAEFFDWNLNRAVRAVAWSPDGDFVAVGTDRNAIDLDVGAHSFNRGQSGEVGLLERGEEAYHKLGVHDGSVNAVAFSPDGRYLASVGDDRLVKFWDVAERREVAGLEWHTGAVLAVAFSPDGQTLATGGADGVVKLWPWQDLIRGA
jgi:hypothetical protein